MQVTAEQHWHSHYHIRQQLVECVPMQGRYKNLAFPNVQTSITARFFGPSPTFARVRLVLDSTEMRQSASVDHSWNFSGWQSVDVHGSFDAGVTVAAVTRPSPNYISDYCVSTWRGVIIIGS